MLCTARLSRFILHYSMRFAPDCLPRAGFCSLHLSGLLLGKCKEQKPARGKPSSAKHNVNQCLL